MHLINAKTNYIYNEKYLTMVNNEGKIFEESVSLVKFLNESCKKYGSDLRGRINSSKYFLNYTYKVPIVINEYEKIVIFPTSSLRDKKCMWINVNNIKGYSKLSKDESIIVFKNEDKIVLNVSIYALENQILKCYKLKSLFFNEKQ